MSAIKLEQIAFAGWPHCIRLANAAIELVVTTDVGPRVIYCGLPGGENEFAVFPAQLGRTGDGEWLPYGGHRLWHAPESMPRTYEPDNSPLLVEPFDAGVRLTQPVESVAGIEKQLALQLHPDAPSVEVKHRLTNRNVWPVELAPWAVTMMAPGGVAICPLPPRRPHPEALLPANTLSLWPYTDMSDPRWTWGNELVMLRQDPTANLPQKAGVHNLEGWVAYARAGRLFVKRFRPQAGAHYPDLNATIELFTNREMLEVETLGPLVALAPGMSVDYLEQWELLSGVPQPASEAEALSTIAPAVGRTWFRS
jgi:hypothetical protein